MYLVSTIIDNPCSCIWFHGYLIIHGHVCSFKDIHPLSSMAHDTMPYSLNDFWYGGPLAVDELWMSHVWFLSDGNLGCSVCRPGNASLFESRDNLPDMG